MRELTNTQDIHRAIVESAGVIMTREATVFRSAVKAAAGETGSFTEPEVVLADSGESLYAWFRCLEIDILCRMKQEEASALRLSADRLAYETNTGTVDEIIDLLAHSDPVVEV